MSDRNILTNLKRYNPVGKSLLGMAEDPSGSYVRYDDVKHLLHDEPRGDRYIGEAVPLGPQGPPQASVITAYDPTTQTAHVRKISAFHCDFGCDVPSHKPGCPFYVNRGAEHGT